MVPVVVLGVVAVVVVADVVVGGVVLEVVGPVQHNKPMTRTTTTQRQCHQRLTYTDRLVVVSVETWVKIGERRVRTDDESFM